MNATITPAPIVLVVTITSADNTRWKIDEGALLRDLEFHLKLTTHLATDGPLPLVEVKRVQSDSKRVQSDSLFLANDGANTPLQNGGAS